MSAVPREGRLVPASPQGQLLSPPLAFLSAVGSLAVACSPLPRLPAPSPRGKGETGCRTDVANNPRLPSPQRGARVAGGKGSCRERPPSFLHRELPRGSVPVTRLGLTGREAGSARDGRLPGHPGLPLHTRTLPWRPRSREEKLSGLCPRPGRRDLLRESEPPGCEGALPQAAASGLMGLSLPPALRGQPSIRAGCPRGNGRGRSERVRAPRSGGPGCLGTPGEGQRCLLPSVAVGRRGGQRILPPRGSPGSFPAGILAGREAPQALDSSCFESPRSALPPAASRPPGEAPGRAAQKSRARGGGRLKKKKSDDESDFPSESLKVSTSSKHGTNLTSPPPSLPPRPTPGPPLPRLPLRAGDTGT